MYTAVALNRGSQFYGAHDRFAEQYGLPPGRRPLSSRNLEQRFPQEYRIKRVLDRGAKRGGTGNLNEGVILVQKTTAPNKGQLIVVKRIEVQPEMGRVLEREIEILHVLKHPNIIGFIDGYMPKGDFGQAQLAVEFCDLGSLQDLIAKYYRYNWNLPADQGLVYVPESFVWHVFESLASALAYIHHGVKGDDLRNPSVPMDKEAWPLILHRDIKPENIFLKSMPNRPGPAADEHRSRVSRVISRISTPSSSDPQSTSSSSTMGTPYPQVILADFGVCTQINEPDWDDGESFNGTVNWMSPELPDTTSRSEVWTVGAIALSLCKLTVHGPVLYRDLPSNSAERAAFIESPEARKGIRDMSCGGYYSVQLRDMIKRCLRFKAEHRPYSWQMLGEIRTARAEAKFKFRPLPRWVFARK